MSTFNNEPAAIKKGSIVLFPFLIFAEPEKVFERVATRSPWLAPLMTCIVGFFVVTWLGGCWTNIREGLRWWSLLGPAIGSTLLVGMTSLGSTVALYSVAWIAGTKGSGRPTYRMLFSLNTHCAPILILGELINVLVVRSGVLQDLNLALPNRFPLGLDLLLLGAKEPNIYLTIFLHSTSIFVLWYLAVLASGLKHISGLGSARSAAIAAAVWLLCVGLVVGIIYNAGGGTVFRVTM